MIENLYVSFHSQITFPFNNFSTDIVTLSKSLNKIFKKFTAKLKFHTLA